MKWEEIQGLVDHFTLNSEFNRISEAKALTPACVGLTIFETPLIACASADDELFGRLKRPEVIGEHFMLPGDWLPEARSVISFFFPYNQTIKKANAQDFTWPAPEWLHGRIEGQRFLNEWTMVLRDHLLETGYTSVVPALDSRFRLVKTAEQPNEEREFTEFSSVWSERHAAFVAGLGTFGLSRGLITAKGMCGRLCSIITDLELPPTLRPYNEVYAYCNMCGACIKHCPIQAIALETGKDHVPCSGFLHDTSSRLRPYYGCGKCQVRIPCESRIPPKPKRPREVLPQYQINI